MTLFFLLVGTNANTSFIASSAAIHAPLEVVYAINNCIVIDVYNDINKSKKTEKTANLLNKRISTALFQINYEPLVKVLNTQIIHHSNDKALAQQIMSALYKAKYINAKTFHNLFRSAIDLVMYVGIESG